MRNYRTKVSQHFSEKVKLGEVLHKITGLDFAELALAAARGAVWHQRDSKGKILRIRSLHQEVRPSDTLIFYYDPRILQLPEVAHAECLFDCPYYGVWVKDTGVMPQGTQTGDHTSLLRFVEKQKKKEVFLVHRLDRETSGLMVIAYQGQAAARLSDLFVKNQITKTYQAIVKGEMTVGEKRTIDHSLDGKSAVTHLEVLASKPDQSLVQLTIDTGRLHQIRRHLDIIGHPVMGDPKYGHGNKNRNGLQLLAHSLNFIDPWTKETRNFTLPQNLEFTRNSVES